MCVYVCLDAEGKDARGLVTGSSRYSVIGPAVSATSKCLKLINFYIK